MTGRPAPSRGALPLRRASYVALCIIMLVAATALATSVPDSSGGATAAQAASPGSTATPSLQSAVDWSNGSEPIWTLETGNDYWAGNFPLIGGGVFGVTRAGSGVLQVFDAMTLERLWVLSIGSGGYAWRPTDEAFFVRHDSSLSALDPRSGTVLWERDFPGERWEWTTSDGIAWAVPRPPRFIYITNSEHLTVLDLASGETRFDMAITGDTIDWRTEGEIMTVTSDSSLKVVDLGVGNEVWQFVGSGEPISWETGKDALYVISGNDISALDPANGTELWQFPAVGNVSSVRTIEDKLYARSGSTVASIDRDTGVELWRYSMAGTDDVWWDFVEDEHSIYLYGGSTLSLLDAGNGIEKWRFTSDRPIYQGWIGDGAFTIATDQSLISVDATSGVELWQFTTNAEISSFSDHGDRLTFIADEALFAIDASTGEELLRTEKMPGAVLVDYEGGVYHVIADDNLLIDATTGEILLQGQWIGDDGVLFADDGAGLVAYDLDNREALWRHSVRSPLVLRSVDGPTLLYTTGNSLVALDKATGAELWTYMAEASIESFAIDESVIRLTDSYGTLYALAPKPIQLEAGGTAVTKEKITLRGAPNESAVERATLPADVTVTITGAPDESSGVTWWPVTTGEMGEQGWVPAAALAPTGNAPAGTETPAA